MDDPQVGRIVAPAQGERDPVVQIDRLVVAEDLAADGARLAEGHCDEALAQPAPFVAAALVVHCHHRLARRSNVRACSRSMSTGAESGSNS